jgi:hypothetical protein
LAVYSSNLFPFRRVEQVPTLQRLHKEEAQRRDVETDRQGSHLPLAQQVRLVGPEMRLIQPVRPALEMSGELLDRVEIRRDGRGREVTALELLQHDAATMGHKTPPVTHTLPGGPGAPHAERPPRQRLGPNADLTGTAHIESPLATSGESPRNSQPAIEFRRS